MATLKQRLDGLNTMIGNKLNKLYDVTEKNANKKNTLTGHGANDTVFFPSIKAVNDALGLKVDKVSGKQLSTEDFTTAFKSKLESLESSKFRGTFTSEANLPAAGNTEGSYADVDSGNVDEPATRWIWDNNDSVWIEQIGASTQLTAAEVKTLYESNPDTFAFTQAWIDQINQNDADIDTLMNELITYYKPLGEEFADYASNLNAATPNITVV